MTAAVETWKLPSAQTRNSFKVSMLQLMSLLKQTLSDEKLKEKVENPRRAGELMLSMLFVAAKGYTRRNEASALKSFLSKNRPYG